MGLRRPPQAIVHAPGFVPGPVPGSGRYTELGKLNRGLEIDFVEHRVQARVVERRSLRLHVAPQLDEMIRIRRSLPVGW